jgi:hypothetical protein
MAPETLLGPTRDSTVVLEVGGAIGALVLYTPESFLGLEIDITPDADPSARTHSAVRERRLPRGSLFAAVYPQLSAGTHTLWSSPDRPVGTVTIVGGQVTEVGWSDLGFDMEEQS